MPWSPGEFKGRHNKAASPAQAKKGSEMANAMLREGVDEGIAIATANKHIQKMKRRGRISEKAAAKHLTKYGNEHNIDASSR